MHDNNLLETVIIWAALGFSQVGNCWDIAQACMKHAFVLPEGSSAWLISPLPLSKDEITATRPSLPIASGAFSCPPC